MQSMITEVGAAGPWVATREGAGQGSWGLMWHPMWHGRGLRAAQSLCTVHVALQGSSPHVVLKPASHIDCAVKVCATASMLIAVELQHVVTCHLWSVRNSSHLGPLMLQGMPIHCNSISLHTSHWRHLCALSAQIAGCQRVLFQLLTCVIPYCAV